jgi:hypothetical protein
MRTKLARRIHKWVDRYDVLLMVFEKDPLGEYKDSIEKKKTM